MLEVITKEHTLVLSSFMVEEFMAVAALVALQEKKQAMQKKELMAAIEKTDRSYE